MFLHVGADVSVLTEDIVAILDIKAVRTSPATKEFIELTKDEGSLFDIAEGEPKSFVVTVKNVYLSPISAATLGKRAFGSTDRLG